MEGFSIITYKGKTIYYADYSNFFDAKDKAIDLLKSFTAEYQKLPPKSALGLVNVANLHFDSKVMDVFKEERTKTAPYEKKTAVIGLSGLQKIAYNFIVSLTQSGIVKAFNTELEAKEWLVND